MVNSPASRSSGVTGNLANVCFWMFDAQCPATDTFCWLFCLVVDPVGLGYFYHYICCWLLLLMDRLQTTRWRRCTLGPPTHWTLNQNLQDDAAEILDQNSNLWVQIRKISFALAWWIKEGEFSYYTKSCFLGRETRETGRDPWARIHWRQTMWARPRRGNPLNIDDKGSDTRR